MRSLQKFAAAVAVLAGAVGVSEAATIFVDFGQGNSVSGLNVAGNPNVFAAANSVALNGNTIGSTIALNDNTNTATGYTATITDTFFSFNGTASVNITPGSAADLAGFTPFATGNYFGAFNFTGGATDQLGQVTFGNLDPTLQYTFTIFANRGTTENRETLYTVAGSSTGSAALNPGNNVTNVAVISGIQVNALNQIVLSVADGPNNANQNKFSYINALRIDTAPIPEPASLGLLTLGALALGRRKRR